MKELIDFDDYREFLKETLEEKRQNKKGFSYGALSKKLGLQSRSFMSMVINRKRNLGENTIDKLNEYLGLSFLEGEYFKCLVYLNQSRGEENRQRYGERLSKLKHEIITQTQIVKTVDKSDYSFLESYISATLYGLISEKPLKEDPVKLSFMFLKDVTADDISFHLNQMIKSGHVIRKDGWLRVNKELIGTYADTTVKQLANLHADIANNYDTYFEKVSKLERVLRVVVMNLAEEDIEHFVRRVLEFLDQFNRETLQKYKERTLSKKDFDLVFYTLNVAMAPITKKSD